MDVSFLSFDDNQNKISFKTKVLEYGEQIVFEDKSCDNTLIIINIFDKKIQLHRQGNVNSIMNFELNKTTEATYQNNEGLEFKFKTKCLKLERTNNKIIIHYEMIMDEQVVLTNKISLLFN